MREAPSLAVVSELNAHGAAVVAHDLVVVDEAQSRMQGWPGILVAPSAPAALPPKTVPHRPFTASQ